MELRGQLEVVVHRARTAAQLAEVEPHHPAGAAAGADLAVLDVQHRILVARLGQVVEGGGHVGVRLGAQRRVVQLGVGERAAPVVGAGVHVDHLELRVEQLDGRQDALAVQAVRVQVVGLEVRRGDERDAVLEQRQQQPVQDHRVGDIGDVELVEADEPVAQRDAAAELLQRVGHALQVLQLAVHLAHELVEVQAHLALQGHGLEEAVHQEALAAPHPAVHVDAARDGWAHQHLGDGVGAARLVRVPLVLAALQRGNGVQLRGVGGEAALTQGLLIQLGDGRHEGIAEREGNAVAGAAALQSQEKSKGAVDPAPPGRARPAPSGGAGSASDRGG